MARIDVYVRSIRQLGARGAVLTSGQAVTLRFPTGDRHATQITGHEQLIALAPEPATKKPNPERVSAFFAKHPETARAIARHI